jgi:hypothetical protein
MEDKEALYSRLQNKNCINHPTIIFKNKRTDFYRNKFIYSQDYDFYLSLLTKNKKVRCLAQPLLNYRVNPKAISFSKQGKQKLFLEKAREFYFQRISKDKDKYNKFLPNKILCMDIRKSNRKSVLESEIKANFALKKFKKMKGLCKKYFKKYGYSNKFIIYYMVCFLGKKNVGLLLKLVPLNILRKMNN